MSNINTAIRYVPDCPPNEQLVDLTEAYAKRDNAAFLTHVARALREKAKDATLAKLFDRGGVGCIGLIGEYGALPYGIRRAQEVIRVDRTPSYWSHAFLIGSALSTSSAENADLERSAWVWESSLASTGSFRHFVGRHGAGARRIADYRIPAFDFFSPHSVPNIAVIAIGLTADERKEIMVRADHPDVDQLHYDLPALQGTWFAYLTNRADRRNPLSEGQAEFSAAYVQLGYEAAGIDLAPGAHQRNIAPEHIWQAAKYLYTRLPAIAEPAPTVGGPRRDPEPRPVIGWYCTREKAGVLSPPDFTGPKAITEAIARSQQPLAARQAAAGPPPRAPRRGRRD